MAVSLAAWPEACALLAEQHVRTGASDWPARRILLNGAGDAAGSALGALAPLADARDAALVVRRLWQGGRHALAVQAFRAARRDRLLAPASPKDARALDFHGWSPELASRGDAAGQPGSGDARPGYRRAFWKIAKCS